jgi:hypothetical protein
MGRVCGQHQQHQLGFIDSTEVTGSHHQRHQGKYGAAAAASSNLMNNYQQYQQMMTVIPSVHQQRMLRHQQQLAVGLQEPPEHAANSVAAPAGPAGGPSSGCSLDSPLPSRSLLSPIVTCPAGGSNTSPVGDILFHAGTPGSNVTPAASGQVRPGQWEGSRRYSPALTNNEGRLYDAQTVVVTPSSLSISTTGILCSTMSNHLIGVRMSVGAL